MSTDQGGGFSSRAGGPDDRSAGRSRWLVQPSPDQPAAGPDGNAGLIVGVVAAVLALALCLGGGTVVAITAIAVPTPNPTARRSVNSEPDHPALVPFQDVTLREFARAGATKASDCGPATDLQQQGTLTHALESVQCTFANGYQVLYIRYESIEERKLYRESAAKGFNGESVAVDVTSSWADEAGNRRGAYIAGTTIAGTRYIYWDLGDHAITGELYAPDNNKAAAEAFWREIR
ncbi:MAG TPA: hypothetical protein VGR21_10975 [Cryptosporangiaceae bacterium]|nr:hypothetical protein [Cryptosporangiaceae bacterium]